LGCGGIGWAKAAETKVVAAAAAADIIYFICGARTLMETND
jgi:hypothetical protein